MEKNGRRDAGRIYEAEGLNFFGRNFGKKKERAMMLVSNFRWIKENVPDWVQAVVASPDEGGTRRAGQFFNNIEE